MVNITVTVANMSELVKEAFHKSLFKDGEDTSTQVNVKGIVHTFGFHPQRLEEQRNVVTAILKELPKEFKEGYTFLNLCLNKDGELWTGEQMICEQLMTMAIGLDLMTYCLPKELWAILPGGVPYVMVK